MSSSILEAFTFNESQLATNVDGSSINTVEKQINIHESLMNINIEDEACAVSTQKTTYEYEGR